MQWKVRSFLFVMLIILGSVCVCPVQVESRANPTDYRVSNETISVGVSKRNAGAVSSIVYDAHEFVNDYDHGRQMQIAWFVNGLDGEYNPTEAGSRDDYKKSTSTSRLVSVRVKDKTIATESHPAYWWGPGKGVNVKAVTQDTLKKTITLGYGGDPHVIVFDAAVTISPELTGPPVNKIRISVPAFYSSKALTEHYQFDRRDGTMVKLPYPVQAKVIGGQIEIMKLNPERQRIPILSSPDGRYAVGAYTPQAENFWNYGSYFIPDPASACSKVSVRFEHAAKADSTYSYRTFVIIGNLETVKKSAMKLR